MSKPALIIACIFVAAIVVVILISLFKLIRSYFRYKKRMNNETENKHTDNI